MIDHRLRLSALFVATLILATIILCAYALSADMTICRSVKPPDREWWSWREVDGRRCWYRGARNKPKTELRWSGTSTTPVLVPVVERPGVQEPPPRPGSFLMPFRASYDVRQWLNPTPIKEWQVWRTK